MQTKQHPSFAAGLAALVAFLLLIGCATSSPSPQKKQASATPPAPKTPRPSIVCANDSVKVRVETASGVTVGGYRRTQLAKQIEQRLEVKKALNKTAEEKRHFEVTVTLTRFEEGSPLSRLISGKMGEIDIDSIVRLRDLGAGEQLSEFTIRENFARGGIGGFSTTYSDAESSFVDGVAVALTGRASPRPDNREWTLR